MGMRRRGTFARLRYEVSSQMGNARRFGLGSRYGFMMPILQVSAEYHHRVWGGQRLRVSETEVPYGEAWIIHENNRVASGPFAGKTLNEVTLEMGQDLLGANAVRQTGMRFPLLIKILDCADWLSVQVHPNDAQAVQLEGQGFVGKTEAWHILEAEAGATLIAGVKPGTSSEALAAAIRDGSVLEVALKSPAGAGDSVMMYAGTMHALGPGFLLYEVQQTSDITYRVFDWNRPASAGRALHIEQSVAVTRHDSSAAIQHLEPFQNGSAELVQCPYFQLEALVADGTSLFADTKGSSFHAITVTEGEAEIVAGDERIKLGRFESVIVPANFGKYEFRSVTACKALRSSVPA
jgi:mannose-6-phosphate isomerase